MTGNPFEVLIESPQFRRLPDRQGGNQAIHIRGDESPPTARIADVSRLHMIRFVCQQDGEPFQGALEPAKLICGSNPAESLLQYDTWNAEPGVPVHKPGKLRGQGPCGPLATKHQRENGTIEDNHRFLRPAL
jgi:hypothetical protein